MYEKVVLICQPIAIDKNSKLRNQRTGIVSTGDGPAGED